MNRVPLFSPARPSHDSDSPIRSARCGERAVGTSRDPRDWRARRQARRFRLVVKRSRQTGLYGLLEYASRRSVADGLTLDQLEDALASCR
jgi:hypothetical protein